MLVVAVAVEFVGGFLEDEAAIERFRFPVTPDEEAVESTGRGKFAAETPSNEGEDADRGGNVSMRRRFVFSSLFSSVTEVVVIALLRQVEALRSLVGTVCGSVRCLMTCKTSF